jgi:hypothetical protein
MDGRKGIAPGYINFVANSEDSRLNISCYTLTEYAIGASLRFPGQ